MIKRKSDMFEIILGGFFGCIFVYLICNYSCPDCEVYKLKLKRMQEKSKDGSRLYQFSAYIQCMPIQCFPTQSDIQQLNEIIDSMSPQDLEFQNKKMIPDYYPKRLKSYYKAVYKAFELSVKKE